MFAPNTKVVCINDVFPLGIEKYYPSLPKEGEMYVIRDVVPGVAPSGDRSSMEVAVYLVEIIGSVNRHGIERGFNAERFAPLQTTDDEKEEEFQMPDFAPAVKEPELVPA